MRILHRFLLSVVFGALALALACGGGGGGESTPPPTAPTITNFTANPTSITTGQSSTLAWAVTGATSLSIDQGVGTVTGTSTSVTPAATTIFTLTATNGSGSNTATTTVTVVPVPGAPTITSQPINQTVNSSSIASFTVAASGNPSPTFTWKRSNDSGNTWNAVGGAVSSTYSLTTAKTDNQAEFQATASNSFGAVTSNAATLTVQWLSITSQPAGQAVTAPNSATFTVAADANPTPIFQWQSSPDGNTWSAIPGATGSSYTITASSVGISGTQYRCVVSNAAATLTSDPAALTVNAPLVAPAFTLQPVSLTVNSGSIASFTVAASGNPSPTFTWKRSNDSGNTWNAVGGAVSSTYSFTAKFADNGAEFQAVATNSVNTAISAPATLTVTPSVYVGGLSRNYSGSYPGFWLNGNWVALSSGQGQVNSLVVSGSNVYAAGIGTNSSDLAEPGYWLNGNWVGLTNGGPVSSLAVSGSDVYAAGYSNNSSQPTTPGYWLDGTWVGLTPLSGNNSKVLSIDVFGTDVYAGGYSQNSSDWYMPGYWFNGTWVGLEPLEGFASYSDSEVTAIAVSGGNVYAGGYCNDTSYVNHPGYWVNGIWVDLLPSGSIGGEVTSIAVSGTDVYAGGYVGFTRNISGTTSTIGVSYPCYWHNGTLIFLSYPQTPNQTNNGIASSIVVSGNNLYAGGNVEVESAPAGYVPGYWINGTWTPLTLPSGATEGFIFSIVVQ